MRALDEVGATANPLTAAALGCVAVAFSGGRDSLALLHATCRSARALGLQVVALHIHHGLLPEADAWLRWAQRLCARWQRRGWPLQLRWARLSGQPAAGDSVEAWARAGRYAALSRLAHEAGAGLVLLAHHRRDQAETVLLQALRGGGAAGLSAMPARVQRDGLVWARPWLRQPREAIDAYVIRQQLRPLQDPSNLDPRWARNRLRLQVWPALKSAFGDAETALASVARHAQEAQAVLAEVAALDLAPLQDDVGGLRVLVWRQLSPARQANALRAWWMGQAGQGASNTLVARLLAEIPAQGAGRWPVDGQTECVLYRGVLRRVVRARDRAKYPSPAPGLVLDLSQPGHWPVPGWGGGFEVCAGRKQGASPEHLRAVQVFERRGGERFQASTLGLPRALKKQFQAAGVAAAGRIGPLLWARGQLLFVPGLGLDARCWAPADEPQLTLCWCPHGVLSGQDQPAG